ncbi:MAG: tetratricopeptide repeat protein [Deltaproteobacteria bacterium]|nr:tetratricopeptide repeat protein [Deltaproteobacteria bacterium]
MGEKRGKNRNHLFFHGTCILVVLLLWAGCVTTPTFQKKWQGHKHLDLAEESLKKGDYEGALKEYDQVLRLFPSDSPGDKALYHMGIIWAHPDNPRRDYKKALEYFQRLAHNFPQSDLNQEGSVWLSVMNEYNRCRDRIKSLEEEIGALQDAYIRCGGRIEHLEETVDVLTKRLEALKEIDIKIEEKKRKDGPGNQAGE